MRLTSLVGLVILIRGLAGMLSRVMDWDMYLCRETLRRGISNGNHPLTRSRG